MRHFDFSLISSNKNRWATTWQWQDPESDGAHFY